VVALSRRDVLKLIIGGAVASGGAVGVIRLSQVLNQHHRILHLGMSGDDVTEVQIRVAGWASADHPTCGFLRIDGYFDRATEQAVRNFCQAYNMPPRGVVDDLVWEQLGTLVKPDGSTLHFDWSEFYAPGNPSFEGGSVSKTVVTENIRRLMFKLEALRLKAGGIPVFIVTGYRPKNSAALQEDTVASSLHTYGIATDIYVNMNRVSLYRLAETCGFSGLGEIDHRTQHCDSRLEYSEYPSTPSCWWQSGMIS
jgi:zinc D-Ala-D-Ala carboxypeptidase